MIYKTHKCGAIKRISRHDVDSDQITGRMKSIGWSIGTGNCPIDEWDQWLFPFDMIYLDDQLVDLHRCQFTGGYLAGQYGIYHGIYRDFFLSKLSDRNNSSRSKHWVSITWVSSLDLTGQFGNIVIYQTLCKL